jgi:LysR family transcriptional regulator, glycine cleavage system transcriptional activator
VALSYLKSLQALEAAVRLGSLKKAADMLSITPAAVGQRVKALEDYLGVELLVRARSGLQATPELLTALASLANAFRELDTAADLLSLQRRDEIHIAAPSDFAELWLQPRLTRFRQLHPNLLFCINGEGDARPRMGRIDCEIRFAPPDRGQGVDLLFHDFLTPISSPENAERLAKIARRARLEGFPLLHLDFYKDDPAALRWPDWIASHRLKRTAPNRGIRYQRLAPAVEAVLSNAGLMICGLALIHDLVDAGRLALPFSPSMGALTQHAFQARFRVESCRRPPVQRFRTWLVEESAVTRARIMSWAGTSRRAVPAAKANSRGKRHAG